MDSRDIQEMPPVITDGSYLENIYSLQKELLDHYIKIEGLPTYIDFDINVKKNQAIIKDFTARIIEELGESYESMVEIDKISTTNKYWFGDYSDKDLKMAMNHLQNAGEEMADAMHFMMELLIYSDIAVEDIKYVLDDYQKTMPVVEGLENLKDRAGILGLCMLFGVLMLKQNNPGVISSIGGSCKDVDLLTLDPDFYNNLESGCWLYECGRSYNPHKYQEFKYFLWDITYELSLARNCLKNKPWKQSQMMTDERKYRDIIIKAFIIFMGTLYVMGLDPEKLFYLYFKKNKVNQFRIKSKY